MREGSLTDIQMSSANEAMISVVLHVLSCRNIHLDSQSRDSVVQTHVLSRLKRLLRMGTEGVRILTEDMNFSRTPCTKMSMWALP